MLQELYKEAVKTNADVVICDYWVNSEHIIQQQPSAPDHLTILQELFQQLHGSCCNKFLKRTCYNIYKIRFHQELTYCEDLTFWVQLYKHPIKTSYLPKAFYHYIQHSESICKIHTNFAEDMDWLLIKLLKKDLKDYHKIRRNAIARLSLFVVEDAFQYGNFTTFSFVKRHCKYVPYFLRYKNRPLSNRLFLARVCLGMYGYYKKQIK